MVVDPTVALLDEIGVLEDDAPLLREHCKEFKSFVREFWDTVPGTEPLLWNWHIDYECEELQRIAHRVSARMPKKHDAVFNVPFGTSKSSIISILWQAWIWTFMPDCRVISATHTQSLVRDLAGKFYAVVTSEKYKACWPIKFTSESTDELKNDKGGERMSCTVGGKTPTGRHAHIVIIDDPIDPQGARSEAELENARKFMSEVIPSRVVDKDVSVIILVMQRLHFRDPTAVMMDLAEGEDASPLLVVRLPGELLSGEKPSPDLDILRHRATIGNWKNHDGSQAIPYENGLLDPRRLSQMVLNRYKRRMGAYSYAGQVLQKPTPPGGGMFKETYFLKRVKAAPYHCKRIRYWDRAACLIAGTMVYTNEGNVPIENIREGDLVLTRNGFRRVKWAGVSGYVHELSHVKFANGSELIGTIDHPVWTENRGWVELASICCSHYSTIERRNTCQEENQIPKWLYSMGFRTQGEKGNDISKDLYGTKRQRDTVLTLCTGPYGVSIMETFPTDTTCITRTKIGITTISPISIASVGPSITKSTMFSLSGTRRRQRKNTTQKLRGSGSKQRSIRNTSVSNAAKNSSLGIWTLLDLDFAGPFAEIDFGWESKQKNAASVEGCIGIVPDLLHARNGARLICSQENAPSVKRSLTEEGSGNQLLLVLENAVKPNGVPVYDLQVEEDHEFFANGILVHNTEDGGCYTAGVLEALSPEGNYFVEHVVHGQWEPVERNNMIIAIAIRDRARYGPNHEPLIVIEAEGGSTGGESFRRLVSQLSGFRVREDRPTGSKDSRAEPWSAQCAAGNVYLVDNGESKGLGKADWDVQGYVQEHCLFRPEPGKRLGKWKDQVDASSGAFNLLAGFQGNRGATVVSYGIGSQKQKGLRVVVVSRENLINTTTDHKCLLVSIQDPTPKIAEEEVMCNGTPLHLRNGSEPEMSSESYGSNGYVDQPVEVAPQAPAHGLNRLLDTLILSFCDIAPVEYQDKWDEVVPPWNETPDKLIMAQDHGRKLWSFLRKQRDPSHEVVVFQDEGDRRALSIAYAFCDTMRLPRSVIHVVGQVEELNHKGDAPNAHIFNQTKLCRGLVV